MYLTQLIEPCKTAGIDIMAAVQLESAHVLWGQGEILASIRMLQELSAELGSSKHRSHVGKSELLATLVGL